MTILPLFERELRVRARGPACYWTRFAAALGGMLVSVPALMTNAGLGSSPAQMGAFAFNGLVLAAFILCCVSGFITVDGISRERREGTLGLLFLTRVRVLDVLLGNFGAAGLAGLCALAACVPVLIVPILTGGVSGGEAARKALVLFDTMMMSLAAGLWASARGKAWWSSVRTVVLMLVFLVFAPVLMGQLFFNSAGRNISWPGPLSALAAADDINYRGSARAYWFSLLVIHAMTWLLAMGAGVRLRRALRVDEESPARNTNGVSGRESPPGFLLAEFKINFRRHKPLAEGEAPLGWLMRRQKGIRMVVWTGALLETAYYFFFYTLVLGRRPGASARGVYVSWGMNLSLKVIEGCLFAWAASRFFIESRRDGELELLLTTPEGARTMVASQWKRLKQVFWWATVAMIAPSVTMSLFNILLPRQPWPGFNLYTSATELLSCANTIAGMMALVWLGMWYGWSERSQARAVARSLILAKGPPAMIWLFGTYVIQAIGRGYLYGGNPRFGGSLILFWNIPNIVILLYQVCLYHWARRRLESALAPRLPKSGLDWLLNLVYQPG